MIVCRFLFLTTPEGGRYFYPFFDYREGGCNMTLTFSEFMQLCLVVIALINLIFQAKKK
jgi:hypothetical protein